MSDPAHNRSRLRFSIASLLVVTTVVAVWFGWFQYLQRFSIDSAPAKSFLRFGVPTLLLGAIIVLRRVSRR
jgi:hypothetical protein